MNAFRRLLPAVLVAALTVAPTAHAQDFVHTPHSVFGDDVGSSGFKLTEEHAAWVGFLRAREAAVGTLEAVNCSTLDPLRASSCYAFDALGAVIVRL
ncbi:hypothetical protein [Corynebacterium nasicanis]|uniref:Uncharacterized protein n=1 Tax=Corynebacterium nasicanis TaxID=1448267 RepID=A0ABW1QD58_9CORY